METFSFQKHARFMGRFDLSIPEKPVAAWVNSAVFLQFEGKEIWLTAENFEGLEGSDCNNYLEIVLDHVSRNWIKLEFGKHKYLIEADVPEGIHTLEIHKRTELLYGKVVFHDFFLPQGGRFFTTSCPRRSQT
ncbi:hypothetical protein LJC58_05770 [Lachnospiraceae bacterium OttesenSCG-928-D06]|nr:hypothetical protein [Lachnospiraceae bacterium OttesenSCG-928-D06]